jgi:hypothetical protein
VTDPLPTTITGKAFEGAVLLEIQRQREYQSKLTDILFDDATSTALNALEQTRDSKKNPYDDYVKAARASVEMLFHLEPLIGQAPKGRLLVQPDSVGKDGDVRDVLFTDLTSKITIGLSCKNNHADLKHQRISERIDIGAQWFGNPSSELYWTDIQEVWLEIERLKNAYTFWTKIPNEALKDELIKSAVDAVGDEIERQMSITGGGQQFAKFLVGKHDFYKLIKLDQRNIVIIQAFNTSGALGKKYSETLPLVRGSVSLPHEMRRLTYIGKKHIHICMNEGWQFGLRLHTASSKIESSLKFASSALGLPSSLVTIHCPY